MKSTNFIFKSEDSLEIYVYKCEPEKNINIKGVVQIAHGMAETAARYEGFAKVLTENGYIVYINDHRGHGKTAKNIENVGYLAEKDGFEWLVKDMHTLTDIIKKENKDLPIFLLGYSMGSFLTQRYIMLYGKELKGAILYGSNGRQGLILRIGLLVSKLEIKKNGVKAKSQILNDLIFGGYNKPFKPNRTKFDWLNRNNEEVDKYIKDPFCGTVFTCSFYYDFFRCLIEIENKKNLKNVPKDLPIYIFSGGKDPVGKSGKGVKRLAETYKSLGVKDLTFKLYKDGRHDMLNEINKDEVIEDVLAWLSRYSLKVLKTI
ncbi:MAG: alpha/beta hydrolase [Clostridium sp.]|uniref:alpha/beta hydrolase n=1 Tax=Clostridium sp. TaxID=1506 RepID=UPI0039EC66AB